MAKATFRPKLRPNARRNAWIPQETRCANGKRDHSCRVRRAHRRHEPEPAEGARRQQVQDELVVSEGLAGRHSTQSCSSTRSSSNFTGLAK